MKTAIILISEAGLSIAQSLLNELPDSEIFTLRHEEGCTHIESAGKFTAENFNRYDAFVFIGAMGICVRTIAPCVKNKYTDPAVVCVDSTGKFAISVLSGHIGGANELTHQVANILGAEPVVTTQSDCTGLWGLDTLPQRFGWFPVINAEPSTLLLAELAKTPEEKKRVCMNEHISLFVSGKPTALLLTVRNEGTDWMEAHLPPHVEVFYRVQDIKPSRFKLILCVSPQVPNFPEMPMICYVPCVVHLGIGLARLAGPVRKVEKEIMNTLKEYGIMPQSIASISTIKAKSDEPVVKALQKKFPVYFYTAEELAEIEVPHPSKTVMKHMGTPQRQRSRRLAECKQLPAASAQKERRELYRGRRPRHKNCAPGPHRNSGCRPGRPGPGFRTRTPNAGTRRPHSVCRQSRSQGADSLCQGRSYRTQLRFHGFGGTI